MKIDGSCHCGSITYEAALEPEAVGITEAVGIICRSGRLPKTEADASERTQETTSRESEEIEVRLIMFLVMACL